MCCSGAQWKREEVPDHKWDFVDVREFHNSGCMSYFQYCFLYVLVIKSVLVYCSDIYTMVLLLASNHWAGSILESSGGSSAMNVPFSIGKWIFFGCIIFSFLLLAWEAKKSRAIIRSRDISYAFTNVMANNYYSMKSYDHFCFFSQINNSKKKKDDFAFFIFFTFKGWKRLLLADAPRQVINGLTLYSFARSVGFTTDISKWYNGSFAKASVLVSMIFTVTIWVGSFVLLLVAALMYVPLLCYIQGNLKEYCCHKVDKRIAELMKRKNRKRLAKEAAIMRKEAMGDYSHLKDKKGQFKAAPLPQPTLPKIGMDELIGTTGAHAYPPALGKFSGSVSGSISGSGYATPGGGWGHDRDYHRKPGYAESVVSADHYSSYQATAATQLTHTYAYNRGGGGGPYTDQPLPPPHPLYPDRSQTNLTRVPSYSSQEERIYSDDKAPYQQPTSQTAQRSTVAQSDYIQDIRYASIDPSTFTSHFEGHQFSVDHNQSNHHQDNNNDGSPYEFYNHYQQHQQPSSNRDSQLPDSNQYYR
ncbi:hypothetical protein CROQUDRAFT_135859 [Cronartium quercuum f. sp. fusiforme G11]|uniref:Vacuole protein n=1 Tax=Cronartium quercuum f. sp. fusiforme G11 TaxID=708437 RepID=A0A9P6N9B0_9BASI|nr:hypothetical protein CROQUDRAFT_135859 [Cronartium quercuum f. sp. fusiforme G11]